MSRDGIFGNMKIGKITPVEEDQIAVLLLYGVQACVR